MSRCRRSFRTPCDSSRNSPRIPRSRLDTSALTAITSSSASTATSPFRRSAPHRRAPPRIQPISPRRWRLPPFLPEAFYIPAGAPKANPTLANTWTWFSWGNSNYNSLQVDLNHRFSHDLALRGVYTWSKALDNGDSLNQTTAGNAPGLVSNPYNLHADYGLATYDVRNIGVVSAVYMLPFGRGKAFAYDLHGLANGAVSGWSVDSIVTLQSGFPITPQLSYNPSNNGDTRNPVRPFVNPNFHGAAIIGKPSQWFNPAAFFRPRPTADSMAISAEIP